MKECIVENCNNKRIYKNGLCGKHNQRLIRYGDINIVNHCVGEKRTSNKLYGTYNSMKQRCIDIGCDTFQSYGGRGIIICDRRLGVYGFTHFCEDMGPRPEGTSIDRIDNNGNYSPENCKRSTRHEQQSNKRNNRDVVGVFFDNIHGRRKARFQKDGRVISRSFKSKEEAIEQRYIYNELYLNNDKKLEIRENKKIKDVNKTFNIDNKVIL